MNNAEGGSMKLISATVAFAALCAVGAGAQSSKTTETTKVKVKDGKEITVSGCVAANPAGGYMMTNTRGDMKYALVGDDDVAKHVGHRIEVRGTATDRGDGKVQVESKMKRDDHKSEAKTMAKGDGLHYLGVKSIKMIADSCS
jgi:hypothetical protein